ncbi:MAG: hypothetical protein JWN95_1637 [Frankiales bacterium]|nr:hypothetical protein [Frankiales bacterium]
MTTLNANGTSLGSPGRSWPGSSAARNALRLAIAAPFVLLAFKAHAGGFNDHTNASLRQHARAIHWGSSDLSFLGQLYPPLPTGVAGLLPSTFALAVLGALGAGVIIEALGARLRARGMSWPALLALLISFGASPSFALTATTDLRAFMALTFLALALEGFLRFAFAGQTHGGFQAGLAIGFAALCDPIAIVCAFGFALAAPLIARTRFRDEKAAGRATAGVLLFPTVAGVLGWTFLCWRFNGSAIGWLHDAAPELGFGHGVLTQMDTATRALGRPLLFSPVFVLALLLLVYRRRYLMAIGTALPLGCVWVAGWVGMQFHPQWTSVLLGVVGVVALPRRPGRTMTALIVLVAGTGLLLKWTLASSPLVLAWQHALLH